MPSLRSELPHSFGAAHLNDNEITRNIEIHKSNFFGGKISDKYFMRTLGQQIQLKNESKKTLNQGLGCAPILL